MPARSSPDPLNEARLLEAALAIVDEAGMDGLSMRKLGASLGVDPMAVYHYFPNKEALLHRVVESVFTPMATLELAGNWQQRLQGWAKAYRGLALSHPNLTLQVVLSPEAVNVAAPLADRQLYAALSDGGFDGKEARVIAFMLVDYINGFVLGASKTPGEQGGAASIIDAFEAAIEVIIAGAEAWKQDGERRR